MHLLGMAGTLYTGCHSLFYSPHVTSLEHSAAQLKKKTEHKHKVWNHWLGKNSESGVQNSSKNAQFPWPEKSKRSEELEELFKKKNTNPKTKTGQTTAVWFGYIASIDTSTPGYGSSEYFLSTSTTTVVLLSFKHKWPGYGTILKQGKT